MEKLSVAFLWHMHQPMYKDIATGQYLLPWVRLHSTYSYLDMAKILEEFPKAKATFNITPSLILQLKDLSEDGNVDDIYMELTKKPAHELTDEDKIFILRNFFSCDQRSQISTLDRYNQLLLKRGSDINGSILKRKMREFSEEDFTDLQILFNLAWCGFTLKGTDPFIKGLVEKGSHFSQHDKLTLVEKQIEVVRSILPLYKKLQDEGRIEISTTPLYHPILPLLCKGKNELGYDFQEDAKVHVIRAIELYEETFGKKPVGMWPAEGSVSQEIIPILAEEGIKWMATDEMILFNSLEDGQKREVLYNAFKVKEASSEIDIVFRDINISNAISFRYSNMPGKQAFQEVLHSLTGIKKAVGDKNGHIVSIILDGENPWPYYFDGGKDFLSRVYNALSPNRDLELVTIGEHLENQKERKEIKSLYRGSWINANFDKWIGSPQKNRAWEYLAKAREDLFSFGNPTKEALEELYIAEGSDWYWWYDEFGTELNFVFDEVFRDHLSNIYKLMGKDVPKHLTEPIPSGPSLEAEYETHAAAVMGVFPKVLIASSEVVPFAKTGGLADVAGSLAKVFTSLGCDVRVIMPLYKSIAESGIELEKIAGGIAHPLFHGLKKFDLYVNTTEGFTTYFIDNKKYFDRDNLYGSNKGDYSDNGFRFSYFSRAVLAAMKFLDFKPDILHCNDWQTALIPFYLKHSLIEDQFYRGIKTLYTIHNMAFQGKFPKSIMRKIGIPDSFFHMEGLEFFGQVNFMKSGLLFSDAVSTVSFRYAKEIMTPKFGCGLDGVIRSRKESLYGILNGVDYSIWSPKSDKFIETNYDSGTINKKQECKKELLESTDLSISIDRPILGTVSRLTSQKGMDIYADIMDKVIKLNVGVIILGKGDEKYNSMFKKLVQKYPDRVYLCSDFNDPLAHKIEAGSDIFIMPSRYEPCGLNQMYSIKYGTIPVVRATGGLDDVIVDFNENRDKGNGFKFKKADKDELYEAIERAVKAYEDKESWEALMKQAMEYDFSWKHSAQQYLRLYKKLMKR